MCSTTSNTILNCEKLPEINSSNTSYTECKWAPVEYYEEHFGDGERHAEQSDREERGLSETGREAGDEDNREVVQEGDQAEDRKHNAENDRIVE